MAAALRTYVAVGSTLLLCHLAPGCRLHALIQAYPHPVQVLGLTNYSRWQDAAAVRTCMAASPAVGQQLLPLAVSSLRKFVHVGVTERLYDSIQSLAATMGMRLDGSAWEVGLVSADA